MFEEPEPVFPDPVAFGIFTEEGDEEVEIIGDELVDLGRVGRVRVIFLGGCMEKILDD